jgi:hypothetical protein
MEKASIKIDLPDSATKGGRLANKTRKDVDANATIDPR